MMSLHPYRLLKLVLVPIAAVAMVMLVGFSTAGPTVSFTSGASALQGLSGVDLFYMVLGVLDLATFVAVYKLARQ